MGMKYCNKPAFAFFLFSALILSVCSQSEEHGHEFNYDEGSGRGPSSWGTLKPKWRNCSVGQRQSPINITTGQLSRQLGDLQRNYSSAPANLSNSVVYIEVEWLGNAGGITINGTVYNIVNCHWHSPSEHTFNGTRYPLEVHLVHSNAQNQTAVVAFCYRFGGPDPFLGLVTPLVVNLTEGDKAALGPVNPESIGFIGRNYYRYMGSLTAPPCSEGVVWTVFPQVKTASPEQVEALRNALPPENRNNSRPTQPLNGRTVLLYDPTGTATST